MSSDSEAEDLVSSSPPQIDPYTVLSLERTATPEAIKSAYRKAALKHHPDKVPSSEQDQAKTKFQQIAFAYAILSDPARRKRYDETGSTSESIVDADGFSWSDYYRAQFADVITPENIAKFEAEYKGSDEEKDDLLAAYQEFEGDMDKVYEHVMLSNVLKDDERFRSIIDEAIDKGEVEGYRKYTRETKKARAARVKAASREAQEADEYAKELGIYDKLNGGGGSKKKTGGDKEEDGGEAALLALIQKNQANRASAFDKIAEKYGAKPKKAPPSKPKAAGASSSKSKKRAAATTLDEDEEEGDGYDDIPDDEFEAIQAKMLKKAKKSK
ncbi:hypothetical protein V8F06_000595 [Rhypophila decipiens]